MDKSWQKIPLQQVISQRKEFVQIDDLQEYKRCRVQLHAKGVILRDIITGALIKTKKQQVCRAGEFLVAEIDAKVGGYGIVPEDLEGAIVSSHYFLFSIDEMQLDRRFLDYFIRTPEFRDQVTARGSTNYAAIRPKYVLNYEIPLPPLSEQQHIVAKIEQLVAKVEEAKILRSQNAKELFSLTDSLVNQLCFQNEFPFYKFDDVLLEAKNGIYKPPHFWGYGIPCIRMYNIDGPGMNTQNLQNLSITDEEFEIYGCKSGDLVFNRVNSAELVGKTGLITKDYPKCTFESKNMRLRVNREKTIPEYAALILNSFPAKQYYRDVLKQQCGMATLNQTHVRNIPFPLPPIEEQRRIVAYLDNLQAKVDRLKQFQAKTHTELDALLPSILDKAFKGEL